MAGIGDLASWLNLRGSRNGALPAEAVVPPGDGPLVLVCGTGAGNGAGIVQALRRRRRGLRLGALGPVVTARGERPIPQVLAEPPADPAAARALVQRLTPAAIVLTDGTIPAALVAAADEAELPVTLIADRHQIAAAAARTAWRGMRRGPLMRVSRVIVPDTAAEEAALRAGIAPQRIDVTGSAPPVLPALSCNMREHAALRPLLAHRLVWLAAALPAAEAPAILAAHRAVISAHHRALLIVAPARPEDAPLIAAAAEAEGLAVARRDEDDELTADIQLLLAEDSHELGLWYRLAPISFMGGTLIVADSAPRHPFEPAALGSAILHGQHLPVHADVWSMLDRAGAARLVRGAVQLGAAIEELGAPDAAARMALAAWRQATAGAEINRRIAEAVLSDLPEDGP